MTVARQLESCLSTLNLFMTLSRQSTLACIILETIHKIRLVQLLYRFLNVVYRFCALNITGDIENFFQISFNFD